MTEAVGVAIIGAAHSAHAWSYARALSELPDARLVGVFDDDFELTRWIRQDFGVEHYDDAAELLRSADVQAAVVCSPTASHRAWVELAASLGCHLLCEKPIATAMDDATAMVTACRASEVQLHIAFVSRFLPMVGRAREAVQSGRLGTLIGMVGGNRGRPPLPPTYPAWITDPVEAGGGALIDHSVHVVDVMRHVSGLEIETVSAEADSLLWGCGVDDIAIMSLGFSADPAGGRAVGSVDPSWSVPRDNPWDYDFFLRLVGTQGALDITDAAESLNVVSSRDQGPRGSRLTSFADDADKVMLSAFVTSIRAGRLLEPCATGDDGVRALRVALAGYQSAASASPVSLT